jgi:excisionase family DNA binding protein
MSQSNFASLSLSNQEKLLTPAEVAALFRVDPKTVTRWAKAGKLTSIRTLGGHRRYKESEVKALLKSITPSASSNNQGLGLNK